VTSLELLAPAGNSDIGMAAIDHGADAVYIGAPRFSARADAGVALDDISRLIEYGHLYYAKTYVALNTILMDDELPRAVEIVHEIFRRGADGLILQDVGLLEADLPPIPLIASTQMHNDSVEKVRFLQDVGFTRVILARELSLREIAAIRRATRIELEAFVHGALCVSYSGQCYMSQAAAGRSGNRGVCAQPCRSAYSLADGNGEILKREKYLLSLRDLNRIDFIPDLVRAGVTSFKIEGRYKGTDYVKNVTAAYRQALDRFIAANPGHRRSSSGRSEFSFEPDLNKTFNRGYTSYFLSGKKEKIASIDTQKATGQYLGEVTAIEKDHFRMKNHDLTNGDGLCFFNAHRELAGFRIDRTEEDRIFPNDMRGLNIGTPLYRNRDARFTRILNKPSARRLIGVEMDFFQNESGIHLAAADEDGNRVKVFRAVPYDPPHDPDRAKEQTKIHLGSTGNTPYHVMKLNMTPAQPGFLPLSVLNAIRRDVLMELTTIREKNRPRSVSQIAPNAVPYPVTELDFRANVLNAQARRFYERHGVVHIEPAFETLSESAGKTVMTTRYCLRHQLDLCPKQNQSVKLPKSPFRIIDSHNSYRLEFDCGKCRMEVIAEGKQGR
jgi:23S rRNA 5-hydroxycytidine C2501 synthase